MPSTAFMPAGWYLTLQPRGAERLERVPLYLFWVPQVGPFTLAEGGAPSPLEKDAPRWEWHGPFASRRGAQLVDVVLDTPVPFGDGEPS